jgi:hypothetical protein
VIRVTREDGKVDEWKGRSRAELTRMGTLFIWDDGSVLAEYRDWMGFEVTK